MKYSQLVLVFLLHLLLSFVFSSTLFAQSSQVLNHTDDMVRVVYPDGATLDVAGVGAIKITLPRSFKNSYVRLKVEIYGINGNFEAQRGTVWLSGFTKTNGASWVKPAAEILSSASGMDVPVYFGDDGNATANQRKPVIWIGDQTMNWTVLKAYVAEVMIVDPQETINFWDDGWLMELDTDDQDNSSTAPQKVILTLPISKPSQTLETVGDITRFTYPAGGANNLSGNGSIKITLPRGNSGSELRIRVELFNYVSGGQSESATIWLSGRNNNSWEGAGAQILTNSNDLALPVYFGYDDANPNAPDARAVIWLGEQNETWNDLYIHVAEVLSGKDNDPISLFSSPWSTDWDIALDAGARDGSSFQEITSTLPIGTSTLWQTDGANVLFTDEDQVAIGLNDPGAFRLAVDGDVKARRVKVTAEDWPDYVFEVGYELRELSDLRAYIQEHGHLPDVPSKEEAEQNGVFVNDMNVLLLQKIEELTLYMLEQEERIKTLEEQLEK